MARTVPSTIAAMQAGTLFTLAKCVKIILRDGTILAFTDLDEDIILPPSAAAGNGATYVSGEGVAISDIELSAGINTGSVDIAMPIGTYVQRADVIGRRFNQATVLLFWIDHSQTNPEPVALLKGTVGDARLEEGRVTLEARDLCDKFHVSIGGVLTPRCRADFGDEKCGVVLTEIGGVITSASTAVTFLTSLSGVYADQYFRFGEIRFTTGELANFPAREVVRSTGSTGEIEVFDPWPAIPAPNDAFIITRGCSRLRLSTDATIPTCLTYGNVTRFRAFPHVPGSDTYLKVPVPGVDA